MTTLWLAGALFLLLVALYGLMLARNLIKIVIIIQLLVKAALFALLVASSASNQLALGQSLAVTVIVADTIVVVIGLALAIRAQARFATLDVDQIVELEG